MDITICINDKKFDKDSSDAIAEYTKRMSAFCNVHINFYKSCKSFPLPAGPHSIGFFIKSGTKSPSSPDLAKQISELQTNGYSSIYYYIANESNSTEFEIDFYSFDSLSLSCFSMSQQTTTIVLTEQLYRAFTILNHITYHK